MADLVPPDIRAFTELESTLRAHHGEQSLYVRPKVYDGGLVVGGWAYLDGAPAMLPVGLTILVITDDGPDGALRSMGRDPAAVLALLGAHVTKHAQPCPHYAITVPEAEKTTLFARIAALPEHRPRPAASSAFDAPAPRAQPSAPRDGIGAWILVGLMVLAIGAVALTMILD